ncbi:MAG: hypothetical protein A2X86_16605 [Bdellovibrionales bacterium GWA2_49_15]|nr:MAG: hypothetical protein A2X86_16605 [Bdellovibrionales bacterium GWA2_49_15]HAZ13727.1 hypothetical protein [Bdellovibrionales bacterium]
MAQLRILKSKDYTRLPWKNGLGYTEQIVIHPGESDFASGDFLWRLSTAPVNSPGPFSLFPEHERFLTIIQGSGIELSHGQKKISLPAFTPYQFSGALETSCELPFGPVVDLNFFWRPEKSSVHFEIVNFQKGEEFLWAPEGLTNFLFLAEGRVQAGEHSLECFDTLYAQGETGLLLQSLSPRSRGISIGLKGVDE